MEAGVFIEFGVEGYAELVALAAATMQPSTSARALASPWTSTMRGARINVSGASPSMPATCPLVRKLPSCLP